MIPTPYWTADGKWVRPRWFALIFGGTYRSVHGGFAWRPTLARMIWRYYREGWFRKYRLRQWLTLGESR